LSIILDALRRGRGRQTPRPKHNAAQTDAVLETLGYGRFKSASPINRLKRVAGLVVGGILLALALWGGVIWTTEKYLAWHRPVAPVSAPTTAGHTMVVQPAAVVPAPRAPAPVASTSAPTGATVDRPAFAAKNAGSTSTPSATADKTVDRPVASTSAAQNAATVDRPNAPGGPIVQNSRPPVPQGVPTPPSGAPSRTALSTTAGTSRAIVTTGEDHFSHAVYYHRLGDFENALFHYKQLLQRDELNAEAHNNLGLLYRDKGLLEDAVKEFQRAIAIQPRYARARNNLGVVYLNQRKLDAAASEFHAALAIDPKNVESLVNLSIVEREAGRRIEARAAIVRALEIDSHHAEAHYNLGLIEDEAGNRQQALVHYRAFLQYGAAGYPNLVAEVRKRVLKVESEK